MSDTIRLAHLSDTHLGYEAYAVLSTAGNNLRGEDVVRAFNRNVAEIIAADPPLVLVSGDIGDRPQLPIRYLLLMRQRFEQLASLRPDGTRRQVVIISGNHDQPRSRRDACFLELFRGLPGVHVVTTDYQVLRVGEAPGAAPELVDVLVHALPHDLLKEVDFDRVSPVPGAVNVLVAHGVAGGSELYLRSLGREYAIPINVLVREWDYVALGHYHKQGPVAVGGLIVETTPIWYAGSTENMGFRDIFHGGGMGRGHLLVELAAQAAPKVTPVDLPIRSMLRLPTIDASSMSPEQITGALVEAVLSAPVAGAVVGQVVTGIPREIWSLVDRSAASRAAASAIHYEVTVRHQISADAANPTSRESVIGGLASELELVLDQRIEPALRDAVRGLATELLGNAMHAAPADHDSPAPDPDVRETNDHETNDHETNDHETNERDDASLEESAA